MEEPIGQDLLQVGFHSQSCQSFPVNLDPVQLFCPVDLHPGAVLHGEHLRGGALPVDAGHFQPVLFAKVLAESVCTCPLLVVVDFLQATD